MNSQKHNPALIDAGSGVQETLSVSNSTISCINHSVEIEQLQSDFAMSRAIAPSLMATATEVVENRRAHETYEVLGWAEPSQNWQTRKPHDLKSLLVFKNSDGSVWQAKPENPRISNEGKPLKYEGRKGVAIGAYTPAIDDATIAKISQVQGVQIPDGCDFWEWLAANPQIPIVVTEGPKSLALLSAGYPAIAVNGCHGAIRSKERNADGDQVRLEAPILIDDVKFYSAGRRVYLAFDCDSKASTIKTVNQAIARTGSLIEKAGGEIFICRWNPQGGIAKGVDDLIFTGGESAWHQAIEEALPLKGWRKEIRVSGSPFLRVSGRGGVALVKPSEAAQILKTELGNLAFRSDLGQFWRYENNLWTAVPDEIVQSLVQKAVDSACFGYAADYISGIIKLLKGACAERKWASDKNLLPFQNGVLNLTTRELMPHSAAHRLTWQVPYEYCPTAKCEPIVDWLRWTQSHDEGRVLALLAFLRAVLLGRSDVQRFVELIGPGGTGKSTFMTLAIALVGLENTHATSFRAIEENRFESALLHGKRFVYFTDSERWGGGMGMLKRITGGDPIPFERKYRNAEQAFVFEGMVGVAANEPIKSSEYTSGLFRRAVPIPFTRKPEAEDVRVLIERSGDRMVGEFAECLPGLVNLLLDMSDETMLQYLQQTSKFVPSLQHESLDNLIAVNPMAAWFDECCVVDLEAKTNVGNATKIRKTEGESGNTDSWDEWENSDKWLYASYCEFCQRSGYKPQGVRNFGDLLLDLCLHQLKIAGIDKGRNSSGAYVSGIALRNEDNVDLPRPVTGAADSEGAADEALFAEMPATVQRSAAQLMRALQSANTCPTRHDAIVAIARTDRTEYPESAWEAVTGKLMRSANDSDRAILESIAAA
jgi:putative DNA primase/helicase